LNILLHGKEMQLHTMTDIQRLVAMDEYEKCDLMNVINKLCDEVTHLYDALNGYIEYEEAQKEAKLCR